MPPSLDETPTSPWRQLTLGGLSALALASVAVVGWQALQTEAKRFLRNFTGGTVSDFPADGSARTRSEGAGGPPPQVVLSQVAVAEPGHVPAQPARASDMENRAGTPSMTQAQATEGAVDVVPERGLDVQVKLKLPGGMTKVLPAHIRLPAGVHFLEFSTNSPFYGQSFCQVQVPPRGHLRVTWLGNHCGVESDPRD